METAQQFNEGYEKRKNEGLRAARERLFSEFSVETLAWLALAPLWPLEFAERSFPVSPDRFISGEEVRELLERLEEHSLVQSGSSSDVPGEAFYTMSVAQRSFVITQITDHQNGNVDYLRTQLFQAGLAMAEASDEDDLLSPPLSRWVELARSAESEMLMSRLVDERVTQALHQARMSKQMGSPEALRWIETAEPFAKLFRGPLEWEVARAGRKLELFHREAYDARYLDNYFVREDQEEAFKELLGREAEDSWALHYVGIGGTGKTMLMRRIKAQLAKEYNLATARVDFDHLNPDYPSRAPGLLLVALAEELRLYDEGGSAKEFHRFDKEIRKLHEQVQGNLDSGRASSISIDDRQFTYVLESFCGALSFLLKKNDGVLLMLDTCEELAKVRSDGSVADNVDMTFRVLERVHQYSDGLRVLFAGRRPLASEGYGWTCPSSPLEKRPYLRLHIIGGLNEGEARRFLERYEKADNEKQIKRKVRPDLIQPIIDQSLSHYEALDKRFVLASGARRDEAENQYSPFLLDIFAMWACSDEEFDARKLKEGGPHLYVKERIVDRVNTSIKQLLPALALLTQFDQKMLAELIKITRQVAVDDLPEVSDREVETIFNELAIQEWVDLDRARRQKAKVLVVDSVMRDQLREYYDKKDRAAFDTASESVARLLRPLTLERPFSELSVEYFDAALRTLMSDPVEAAQWWSQVEARFAAEGNWSWAKDLTDYLLGDEGPAAKADPGLGRKPENECVLRPALLATYAAALTHLNPHEAGPRWQEVLQKADRHPTKEGAFRLEQRAIAGKIAARQWQTESTSLVGLMSEYNALSSRSPASPSIIDSQTIATQIAMLEAITEMLERSEPDDPHGVLLYSRGDLSEFYYFFYSSLPAWWPSDLPLDLQAFFLSLRARTEMLLFRFENANTSFREAMQTAAFITQPRALQTWVDWKRPDNLPARIRLEFVRAMYPARLSPDEVLEVVNDAPPQFDSIASDRLASAVLCLQSSIGPIQPSGLQKNIELSLEGRQNKPTCNAHRAFPAYFATAIEAQARLGEVDQAVAMCIDISKQAELKGETFVQETIDRAFMRIAFCMRLRDEPRVALRDSLQESYDLEDIDLRFMLAALDGSEFTEDLARFSYPPPGVQSRNAYFLRLMHIKARSGYDKAARLLETYSPMSFIGISIRLDLVEAEYLDLNLPLGSQNESIRENLTLTTSLIDSFKLNDSSNAVETLTLVIRLYGQDLSADMDSMIDSELVTRVGKRRAADIAFEEGTLLALRVPQCAVRLMNVAGKFYKECGDEFSLLLTHISLAMLYARLQLPKALPLAFRQIVLTATKIENPRVLSQSARAIEAMAETPSTDTPPGLGLVDGMVATLNDLRLEDCCQRPWIARLAACVARARELKTPGPDMNHVHSWLNKNYARLKDNRYYLPKEFELLFDYAQLHDWPTSRLSHLRSLLKTALPYLLRGSYFVIGLAISMLGAYALFYLFSKLLNALGVGWPLGWRIVAFVAVILLLSKVSAILKIYFSMALSLTRLSLLTKSPQDVADPNRPLQAVSQIAVASYPKVPFFEASLEQSAKRRLKYEDLAATNNDAYEQLAEILPEKARKSFDKLNRWFGRYYVDLQLEVDIKNAGAPWEAIVGFAPKDRLKKFDDNRFRFFRTLAERNTRTVEPVDSAVEVFTLAPNQPQAALAQRGWATLEQQRDQFQYTYMIPQSLSIESNPRTDILHIVGTASDERGGLKIDINDPGSLHGADRNATQSGGPESSAIRGFLASAEELAAMFPQVRVCIVQCIPSKLEPRSSSDRLYSARQRRFGAELYKCGVPIVILLPPMPDGLATGAIGELARLVSSSATITTRALLEQMRKIQNVIAGWDEGDEEARLETAFDVCLYADKGMRLRLR